MPQELSRYVAMAVVAAIDASFGGVRAYLERTFNDRIFVLAFVSNAALAMLLVWVGDQLGVDLTTAVAVVFGVRIFQNLAAIRRRAVRWLSDDRRSAVDAGAADASRLAAPPRRTVDRRPADRGAWASCSIGPAPAAPNRSAAGSQAEIREATSTRILAVLTTEADSLRDEVSHPEAPAAAPADLEPAQDQAGADAADRPAARPAGAGRHGAGHAGPGSWSPSTTRRPAVDYDTLIDVVQELRDAGRRGHRRQRPAGRRRVVFARAHDGVTLDGSAAGRALSRSSAIGRPRHPRGRPQDPRRRRRHARRLDRASRSRCERRKVDRPACPGLDPPPASMAAPAR